MICIAELQCASALASEGILYYLTLVSCFVGLDMWHLWTMIPDLPLAYSGVVYTSQD